MKSKGCVYIIQSTKSGRFYIGASCDPERRLSEHNQGKVSSTRKKGPWVLRLIQWYLDISTAKRIEYQVKRLKRRDLVERMIFDGVIRIR